MLQGLRRTIGRYAPRGGVKEMREEAYELEVDATPMETAVWQFTRQDKALRKLETHLTQMLDQMQTACATMATVADIFAATCRDTGDAFQAATKQIEVQEAERMEQSIRFTVLDPLQARLERHSQLMYHLQAYEALVSELQALRRTRQKLESLGRGEDEKRTEVALYRVAAALQETETTLLPQLDNAIQSSASRILNLCSTTRLQTAIFFRNANQLVLSSLSSVEKEIVAEANPPLKFSTILRNSLPVSTVGLNQLGKLSSVVSDDGMTEVEGSISSVAHDGVDTSSGSDEDDDRASLVITIDDFEAGSVAPQLYTREEDAARIQGRAKAVDPSRVVSLASFPVVARDYKEQGIQGDDDERYKPLCRVSSPLARPARLRPSTSRLSVRMLSSIGKTIRGKLSYASGETRTIRQSSAPTMETFTMGKQTAGTSSRLCPAERLIVAQLPSEWLDIEDCLWEIDARVATFSNKSLLPADVIATNTNDVLYRLLQKHETLYFECLSYLRVEDLARLAKVNFRLHAHLVDNAPIWKKCIRSGGLSCTIRSSLWLSVFYESTPWRSSASASYFLSAERRCSMYDQLLLKVGIKVADGFVADGLSVADDDAQLAVWFREIDVDVVRTCHRDGDVSNNEARTHASPASLTSGPNHAIQTSVASILNEMITTIEQQIEGNDNCESPLSVASRTMTKTGSGATNVDLEAKMRRVLRAYVVYNPRVGYCQGMSFLVRLLADVADDEADLFWLFVGFSEPENDRNLYEPGMAVLQPYLSKFKVLFATHMPELFTHFQSEGVHVATFCTRWFLTFFSSFETLNPTLVTRLLDVFIIDGWRIMFSISLVILEELQQELLKCDMEGILHILKSPRGHMPEPDCSRQQQLVRQALAYSTSRAINSIRT